LTDEEKRANHIESEKKRRHNIRTGFDQLVEIVPTLNQCHRSEAIILQKAVDYVRFLLNQRRELEGRIAGLRSVL
ncbi:Myc-type, basic helix-loop-helix domain-containing protein, partial [Phlyctochytrium arcticum]